MKIRRETRSASGIRLSVMRDGVEIARAWLYLMNNDLHDEPFGLLEDVYVEESARGTGIGTRLVEEVVRAAREAGCYKLLATSRKSRPRVHELYERLGFTNYGIEFRMDLEQ